MSSPRSVMFHRSARTARGSSSPAAASTPASPPVLLVPPLCSPGASDDGSRTRAAACFGTCASLGLVVLRGPWDWLWWPDGGEDGSALYGDVLPPLLGFRSVVLQSSSGFAFLRSSTAFARPSLYSASMRAEGGPVDEVRVPLERRRDGD